MCSLWRDKCENDEVFYWNEIMLAGVFWHFQLKLFYWNGFESIENKFNLKFESILNPINTELVQSYWG